MQITGLSRRIQMDRQIYAHFVSLTHKQHRYKHTHTLSLTVSMAAKSTTFTGFLWEPVKTWQIQQMQKQRCWWRRWWTSTSIVYMYACPPTLPSHLCCFLGWLTDWLATVRILNERPFSIQPVSQSVSHLGKGDLDGESSLASGFDPRVLWQSLGLRNLESLFHRPLSPSTCFHGKSSSTLQLLPYFKHILYTHILCVCQHRCIPGLFFPGFMVEVNKKKREKSNLSWNPVPMLSFCTTLLNTDVWWKKLLHLSSVCECTYCSFPSRIIFCDVYMCVCVWVCMHMYQIGFTCAGSTSLSITMDVQW